tara:strand:+ start:598 stop:846 length:249 start_codon:yes stop_codon:yes gene_type:complete
VLCLVRNDAQIAQTELDVLALGLLLVQHARLARSVSKFAGACRWGPGGVGHGGDYCEQQQRNGGTGTQHGPSTLVGKFYFEQ